MTKKERKPTKEQEYLSGWQRCQADFLNYKKDEVERFKALVDYKTEEWAIEILKIIDLFERAEAEVKKTKDTEGFLHIKKHFINFLIDQGIELINTKEGKQFNPEFEEVIETEGGEEDGIITEIIQKGYTYNKRVIRPTRVKVSKKHE